MSESLELVAEASTDIISAVAANPGLVLLDREKFDAWYEKLAAKAPTDVDVTTNKGREALRSFAAEVRREKAAIDKSRLRLTEEWRGMVKQANEAGHEIKERLENLAVTVRAPLTEWEEREAAREAEVERIIGLFRLSRFVAMGEPSDEIRERGTIVHNIAIDPDFFRDRAEEAEREKRETVDHLFAALKAAEKAEADRAELERLQREAEEREQAERERKEAEEAEQRRLEAERAAEEARVAQEKAEQERLANAAREAEERARREAEEAAEAERQAVERKRNYARSIIEHIKQVGLGMIGGKPYPYVILMRELDEKIVINDELGDLQEEVRAIRDATRATLIASMEREQTKAEQEAREKEERAAEDERRQREADQAHRAKIMGAAKTAIMSCGTDEETAKKIVLAIRAGEVPNVRMEF